MNNFSDNTFSDSDTQSLSQPFNNIINNKIYDKKNIVDRINKLNSRRCNLKIFKIIYSDKVNFSKNDNGIFFNINNLNDSQLKIIDTIINYYEKKKLNDDNINSYDYNSSINKSNINSL